MVTNTSYIGLLVTDNLDASRGTFPRRAVVSGLGNTSNTDFIGNIYNGKIIDSGTTDNWVRTIDLSGYSSQALYVDFEDVYNKVNSMLTGASNQWGHVADYSIEVVKGISSDTFRFVIDVWHGANDYWANNSVRTRCFKGNDLVFESQWGCYFLDKKGDGSLYFPKWYTMLSSYTEPFFRGMTFSFQQIVVNGQSAIVPSMEISCIDIYETPNVLPNTLYRRWTTNNTSRGISQQARDNIQTTTPYPPSSDEGGDGQGQTDEGSTPDPYFDNDDTVVDGFIGNGFFIPFLPTNTTLSTLGTTLWTDSIMQRFINKGIKFTDGIIDLFMIPVRWSNIQSANLNICGIEMGIQTYRATSTFQYVDLGTIDVPTRFGSFVDFRGYSTLKIYLPCIGFRTLNINDYMGKKIKLEYKVCVLDGSFIANIYSVDGTVKKVLDTFNGNCALHMPVSSGNIGYLTLSGMQYYPPLAIARRAFGQDNPDIHNNGTLQGTSAYLGSMTPYLVIDVPKMQVPQAMPSTKGYMSHCMAKLKDLSGYTEVYQIHLDVQGMAEDEKTEMDRILKEGIII